MTRIATQRLSLRPWTDSDRAPLAAMSADPRVMEFMPGLRDRAQSDALFDRINEHFRVHGYGLWAVEVLGGAPFTGYTGLVHTTFDAPFTPCVEIAWMFQFQAWGQGYATEAAQAVCAEAFGRWGLAEIVSFTVPANTRSRRVMERLKMTRDEAEDFDHPRLPDGHPLRRHLLYRLTKARWAAR